MKFIKVYDYWQKERWSWYYKMWIRIWHWWNGGCGYVWTFWNNWDEKHYRFKAPVCYCSVMKNSKTRD